MTFEVRMGWASILSILIITARTHAYYLLTACLQTIESQSSLEIVVIVSMFAVYEFC